MEHVSVGVISCSWIAPTPLKNISQHGTLPQIVVKQIFETTIQYFLWTCDDDDDDDDDDNDDDVLRTQSN